MQDRSPSDRADARATIAPSALRSFCDNLLPKVECEEDAEFLRALLLLGGALFALSLVTYLFTTHWVSPFPRDKATLVLGRDFLNLWMYGRAIFDGDPARFYDVATYNDELDRLLGPG